MPAEIEWPIVLETSTHALVGSKLFEPFLAERRQQNQAVWADSQHWRLGFYFGKQDTRLWVPRRSKDGIPVESVLVINFGHALGRKAFRILMLAYGTGLVALCMVGCALAGVRW